MHFRLPVFFAPLALLLLLCLHPADAHSYLTVPPPYTKECKGCDICPSERKFRRHVHHTRDNPVATWSRGQKVNIKWVKNNHNGGFVRLSFLRLEDTYNATAHARYAFYHGCWEQGRYPCRGRECGADNKKEAFHRYVTIPDFLPDGVYTFAWLWYGGTHFRRKVGLYSDFVSCSYIRIRGGVPVRREGFTPSFDPGYLDKYEHHGLCLTSASVPGQCLHGCDYKPTFYDIPKEFKDGHKPPTISASYYDGGAGSGTGSDYSMSDDEEMAEPAQESEPEVGMPVVPTDYIPGSDYNNYYQSSMGNKDKEEEEEEEKDKHISKSSTYICNHKIGICCTASCGKCEQRRCSRRNGGKWNCCPRTIRRRSGRMCSRSSAPCYYSK